MQSEADIPAVLRAPAEAAVAWINQTQAQSFQLTGMVDTEDAQAKVAAAANNFELGLVLCDGELCAREQVQVQRDGDGYLFSLVDVSTGEDAIPPLLDPPAGVRSKWLDGALDKHEFVLLLFYRGLW